MKKLVNSIILIVALLNSSVMRPGVDGHMFDGILKFGAVALGAVVTAAGGIGYYLGCNNQKNPKKELEQLQRKDQVTQKKIADILKNNPELAQKLKK